MVFGVWKNIAKSFIKDVFVARESNNNEDQNVDSCTDEDNVIGDTTASTATVDSIYDNRCHDDGTERREGGRTVMKRALVVNEQEQADSMEISGPSTSIYQQPDDAVESVTTSLPNPIPPLSLGKRVIVIGRRDIGGCGRTVTARAINIEYNSIYPFHILAARDTPNQVLDAALLDVIQQKQRRRTNQQLDHIFFQMTQNKGFVFGLSYISPSTPTTAASLAIPEAEAAAEAQTTSQDPLPASLMNVVRVASKEESISFLHFQPFH